MESGDLALVPKSAQAQEATQALSLTVGVSVMCCIGKQEIIKDECTMSATHGASFVCCWSRVSCWMFGAGWSDLRRNVEASNLQVNSAIEHGISF